MPIEILMPALSPTMTSGTLATWLVKQGDRVSSGDVIAEIETDKATMEVEAVEEGTIAKIMIPEGTEGVAVNAVIAVLVEEGEELDVSYSASPRSPAPSPSPVPITASSENANPDTAEGAAISQKSQTPIKTPTSEALPVPSSGAGTSGRIKVSPLAKRLAAQQGIDLVNVQGSGPGGRIIKRDIDGVVSRAQVSPANEKPAVQGAVTSGGGGLDQTPFERQKPSSIRKIIARRLCESKYSSPHFYVTMDIELDALLALRKQINEDPDALKVSVNDMMIMAAGRALKAVPEANAAWVNDDEVHQYTRADVSVAVALNGGLVTPVVRGADTLSLSQISQAAAGLIGRAREGKLKPEEMQGGSFSISNMGMMGVKQFTAIINPPQGAILAIGAGEKRPVVRGNDLEIATVMTCTMSSDHRIIDGAVAAKWLGKFKALIENPVQMLV